MTTISLRCLLLAVIGLQMVLMVQSQRLPSRKFWWGRKITNDLYTIGRPTESDIKFAREAGCKSLITVTYFPTRAYVGTDRTDPLINTTETAQLAMDIGLNFSYINNANMNWATLETVQKFSAIFDSFPKPVVLNCPTGYSSSFIALMYYFNRSKTDPNAQPRMNVTTFFQRGVSLGFDYAADENLKTLVLTVDGTVNSPPEEELPRLDLDIRSGKAWKVKPLGKNIYLSGQFGSHELALYNEVGYNVIVNLRKGVTSGGSPTQEESILLNIRDRTGTYDKTTGLPVRQKREVLESNRIQPMHPTTYISPTSQYNYQSINVPQFGDAVGYNETIERLTVEKSNLTYIHAPVGGVYKYGLSLWQAYRDQLIDLGKKNSGIIFQCRTGYRSTVMGILLYGCLYGVNSTEALQMAHNIGYEFEADQDTAVVDLFKKVLDNREQHCESPPDPTTTPLDYTTFAAAPSTNNNVLLMALMVFYGLFSLQ